MTQVLRERVRWHSDTPLVRSLCMA